MVEGIESGVVSQKMTKQEAAPKAGEPECNTGAMEIRVLASSSHCSQILLRTEFEQVEEVIGFRTFHRSMMLRIKGGKIQK